LKAKETVVIEEGMDIETIEREASEGEQNASEVEGNKDGAIGGGIEVVGKPEEGENHCEVQSESTCHSMGRCQIDCRGWSQSTWSGYGCQCSSLYISLSYQSSGRTRRIMQTKNFYNTPLINVFTA
jgi:hypothetical protein